MSNNPRLMLRIARDFIWAADDCMAPKNPQPGANPAEALRSVPAVVNAAFAAELSLKASLVIQGAQIPQSHSLLKLYNRLPEKLQAAIMGQFGHRMKRAITKNEFLDRLAKVADSFETWRYVYENETAEPLDYKFLSEFAAACFDVISGATGAGVGRLDESQASTSAT